MEHKDNPLPLVFVWNTQKFYMLAKRTLFLKAELHNLSVGIYVQSTKLSFKKAVICLISPCNGSMTLFLSEPQYLQLKIHTIKLEIMNC